MLYIEYRIYLYCFPRDVTTAIVLIISQHSHCEIFFDDFFQNRWQFYIYKLFACLPLRPELPPAFYNLRGFMSAKCFE